MIGKLVLLRHGQSRWNLENRFTGWADVELTDDGRNEALVAGQQMHAEGLLFDVVYTSLLKRAIHTLQIALNEMNQDWVPTYKTWRLNERHYGDLQGLDKAKTVAKYGKEQVKIWRRSYDIAPPAMSTSNLHHPANDVRYSKLDRKILPNSESLEQTLLRVMPYLHDAVIPQLKNGKNVLIVAHGNSIRAIYKYLNNLSQQAIFDINIPTGTPLLFNLDEDISVQSFRFLNN